jgi:hypothetical protein
MIPLMRKARDDEEDVDADEAAGQDPGLGVVGDDGEHGDGAQGHRCRGDTRRAARLTSRGAATSPHPAGEATVEHDLGEQVQGAAKPSCVPMSRWRQRERLRADRRPMGHLSEVHREPTNHASVAHWLRRAYVTMPGRKTVRSLPVRDVRTRYGCARRTAPRANVPRPQGHVRDASYAVSLPFGIVAPLTTSELPSPSGLANQAAPHGTSTPRSRR